MPSVRPPWSGTGCRTPGQMARPRYGHAAHRALAGRPTNASTVGSCGDRPRWRPAVGASTSPARWSSGARSPSMRPVRVPGVPTARMPEDRVDRPRRWRSASTSVATRPTPRPRTDEANVPAQRAKASQEARLPTPDADSRGSGGAAGKAAQGSPAALRLSGELWRIGDQQSFRRLLASPRRARSDLLAVQWVPLAEGPVRLAAAASRKVGGAVVRNRLRRRVRACIRELSPSLPPCLLMVRLSPAAASASYHALSAALVQALQATGALPEVGLREAEPRAGDRATR